ncbi:MAG: VanZ family protein [Gemmatimonas sp.]
MKGWRGALLAGSLLFIAVATLSPGRAIGLSTARTDFFCLACGPEGGADVTLNIALFIPLGISLALLGTSPPRALITGALLSVGIETAQYFGLPMGRIASLSDLLTNATGTLIGASVAWHHRRWLQPSPRAAQLFSCVSVLVITTFLGFTGWALGHDTQQPVGVEQVGLIHRNGASVAGFGWFHGTVSQVAVNGSRFAHEGDGPVILFRSMDAPLNGVVDVDGRDERRDFVPFLSVLGGHVADPELMLGQRGEDAEVRVRLRGSTWRLPGPTLPLRRAFAAERGIHRTVRFAVTPERWTLSSTAGTESLTAQLPITLSLGWTLFQSVVHVGDKIARPVTVLWLFLLWLPVGYWCLIAGQANAVAPRNRGSGNIQRWLFVTAGVVTLALTSWLVPRAAGIAPTLPLEWVLSIAGLAAGVFFAARFYSYIPPQ